MDSTQWIRRLAAGTAFACLAMACTEDSSGSSGQSPDAGQTADATPVGDATDASQTPPLGSTPDAMSDAPSESHVLTADEAKYAAIDGGRVCTGYPVFGGGYWYKGCFMPNGACGRITNGDCLPLNDPGVLTAQCPTVPKKGFVFDELRGCCRTDGVCAGLDESGSELGCADLVKAYEWMDPLTRCNPDGGTLPAGDAAVDAASDAPADAPHG